MKNVKDCSNDGTHVPCLFVQGTVQYVTATTTTKTTKCAKNKKGTSSKLNERKKARCEDIVCPALHYRVIAWRQEEEELELFLIPNVNTTSPPSKVASLSVEENHR